MVDVFVCFILYKIRNKQRTEK